jgi:5'-methylthioadenosine phosphorylase
VLRQILLEAAKPAAQDFSVHDRGCYVCMEGPAFSTRAESLMHRLWGGDLIGMTAMPEAKLAREAEISYALVALVTDYDCWRSKPPSAGGVPASAPDPHELLKEIIGNLQTASQNAIGLMKRAVELIAQRRELLSQCPAQHALELGIWSDKSRIDRDEVQRLGPLWMKYL